jgi:hypothetical protein
MRLIRMERSVQGAAPSGEAKWQRVGGRIKRGPWWQRDRQVLTVPEMPAQPGVAAGNVGGELRTPAKPKLKVAGHNVLVRTPGQPEVTGLDDDGAIARWAIDGRDLPALVTSRLLNLGHVRSMPWIGLGPWPREGQGHRGRPVARSARCRLRRRIDPSSRRARPSESRLHARHPAVSAPPARGRADGQHAGGRHPTPLGVKHWPRSSSRSPGRSAAAAPSRRCRPASGR